MDLAYPNPAMAVSGELIRKKPDMIDRFMRAYVRAIHRAKVDRDVHDQNLGKIHHGHRPGASRQDLRLLHDQSVRARALHQYARHAKRHRRSWREPLPAAKNAKPEQFVDLRFLDRLEKSGLLKELYK